MIVDASEMARRGLRALLHAQSDLHVIAECATAREAAAQVVRFEPQVVVLDPVLPEGSGFDTCRRLREQVPTVRVVMLLECVDAPAVVAGVRTGAIGVLSKRAALPEICDAVRAAAAGVSRLDPSATAALFEHVRRQAASLDSGQALTELERRVLARVVAGRTNREIAHELTVSEKTVKSHLSRAFAKLNVTRRARAAVLFVADAGGIDGIHQPHQAA